MNDGRNDRPSSSHCQPDIRLVAADCHTALRTLESSSVDLLLTDGPYPEIDRPYGRLTEADWLQLMKGVVKEARRIVRPSGSAVFLMQPSYSKLGVTRLYHLQFALWAGRYWNLVEDVYWFAPDATPAAGTDRDNGLLKRACKPVVWLGNPGCYRRQEAVLKTPSEDCLKRQNRSSPTRKAPSGYFPNCGKMNRTAVERGGSVPPNVLVIPKAGGSPGSNSHPAVLPLAVADWFCRYLLPPGGTVLDCFCGSGTVLKAGIANGAGTVIGIDKMPGYIETCRERLTR